MISIIGTIGCSKCETLKASLPRDTYKSISFHDLSSSEQDIMLDRAEAVGQRNLPIVLLNGEIIPYDSIHTLVATLKESIQQ